LLWLQLVEIGQFCTLCVIADGGALVAAAAAIVCLRIPQGELPAAKPAATSPLELRSWAWIGLAFAAAIAPLLWNRVRPAPPVPAEVQKLYAPGKINVVEFADFECPFCRLLHERLKAIIESYPGRVHFVRLNMPLDSHPNARGAAYASICAEAQGKGEPMADLLFKNEDITSSGNRDTAAKLGLDLTAFDRCVRAPDTEARVQRESAILRAAGLKGLPTTYVGALEIVGAQPEEVFRDAFERAARGEVVGALVWFGRTSYTSTWEPAQSKKREQSKSPSS
jgi:predicted DsbA family dithiol-disulfide isomerase